MVKARPDFINLTYALITLGDKQLRELGLLAGDRSGATERSGSSGVSPFGDFNWWETPRQTQNTLDRLHILSDLTETPQDSPRGAGRLKISLSFLLA